jgi:SAM-dependent methyltransferase
LKFLLAKKASAYYSIDKYVTRSELSSVGDLNNLPFKEKIFDVIVCLQVIEHTPTPEDVIKNLVFSLKNKGVLIISAPHISYLHGEPEDYYRYTKYGLVYMLEKRGLKVLEISAAGSIFGFLFTPISDFILSYTYGIPVVFQLAFFFNSMCVKIISKIDLLLFKNSIMPLNYVVAAQKGE